MPGQNLTTGLSAHPPLILLISLQAVAQGKESQYAAKRTSIEPSHSDENHPTNRNPGNSLSPSLSMSRFICPQWKCEELELLQNALSAVH
jgi:hypothetical protein